MKQDIEWQIRQWGLWSRKDGTGKISNSASPFFSGLVADSNDDEAVMITDSQAERIEEAICALKAFDIAAWRVIVILNYYGMTQHGASCKLGIDRRTVSKLEQSGIGFIGGALR